MTTLLRGFVFLLVLVAAGQAQSVAASDQSSVSEAEYDPAPYRSDWRIIVPHEIKFDAVAAATPAARKLGLREPPADPEIVTLPTFVVTRKRVEFQDLKRALDTQADDEKVEAVARKLGIGVHGFHTRHFAAGYMTIFHIPFFGGFGWSW